MTCMVCAITLDSFEMYCEHMLRDHNEQKEEVKVPKQNCIMCDTDFNSNEELKVHYSEKHIYCQQCNDFLTDEDAFQKHNLQEHNVMPNVYSKDTIKDKEEPDDNLLIKEELVRCGDCGFCDTCNRIQDLISSTCQ